MSKAKLSAKKAQPALKSLGVPSKSSGTTTQISYEDAVQGTDQPRMTKVSVTIDRGLLSFVDHYIKAHSGTNRSEIFDKALELWAKETQKQADIACYSSIELEHDDEGADWSAIQTEAAKHIW